MYCFLQHQFEIHIEHKQICYGLNLFLHLFSILNQIFSTNSTILIRDLL